MQSFIIFQNINLYCKWLSNSKDIAMMNYHIFFTLYWYLLLANLNEDISSRNKIETL